MQIETQGFVNFSSQYFDWWDTGLDGAKISLACYRVWPPKNYFEPWKDFVHGIFSMYTFKKWHKEVEGWVSSFQLNANTMGLRHLRGKAVLQSMRISWAGIRNVAEVNK